jgi:cell fate regulator YaaT (PSP1 superfamily)
MDEILDDEILQDDEITDADAGRSPSDVSNLPEKLIKVKFVHSSETEYCEYPANFMINHDDLVIASGKYGKDLAKVLGSYIRRNEKEKLIGLKDVQFIARIATEEDLKKFEHNSDRAKEAFKVCREKIAKHKLDMKLVTAHYLLEEPKVLFFFTADSRVDFRELVKDLVSVFKMRIELRQIGVRDESRVVGGLGVCGRDYCCHGLTDKLKPVSIKMAKDQNLSLNSMKISGPCGRLLCCLSYEHDYYLEEKRKFPPEGARILHENKNYKVSEINILSKTVKIENREGSYLHISLKYVKYDEKQRSWKVTGI